MGIKINVEALEAELDVPVIPTIAIRGKGIDTALHRAIEMVNPQPADLPHHGRKQCRRCQVKYDDHVEQAIEKIFITIAMNYYKVSEAPHIMSGKKPN